MSPARPPSSKLGPKPSSPPSSKPSSKPSSPPRLLERRLEAVLPEGLSRDGTLGDLAEQYARRRASGSRLSADAWYLGQTITVLLYRRLDRDDRPRSSIGGSDVVQDLRWAVRSVLRRPGFSLGVVIALGLGLGANSAVFSIVDGTFQSTSWWANEEASVILWPDRPFSRGELSVIEQSATSFETLGAYREEAFALSTGGDGVTESLQGAVMTPALFSHLRVQPGLGRGLRAEDAVPGSEAVIVIGYGLWNRAFGADPAVLGRRVVVNGQPTTVVGVQGPGGTAPGIATEVWVPLVLDPRDPDFWPTHDLTGAGILRVGASVDDGRTDLVGFGQMLASNFPGFYPAGFGADATVVQSTAEQRQLLGTPLLLLLGATGLLLLVASLNVGNMLLARAIDRRQELSIRRALGASRGRVLRQLMIEALVWGVLGTSVGIVLGSGVARVLAELFASNGAVAQSQWSSPRVLAFIGAISAASWTVLFGVPVAHFLRSHQGHLKLQRARTPVAQRSLVALQAALATVLLVASVLLIQSVRNLADVPLGFRAENVLAIELSPPADLMSTRERTFAFYEALTERVAGLPGVEEVGLGEGVPLRDVPLAWPVNVEARPVDVGQAVTVPKHVVDPGFFRALDIRPLSGRLLDEGDRQRGASAIVVNESMARLLWHDSDPVGQRIAIDPHAWTRWITVVGVVSDLRSERLTGPTSPAMYVAFAESPVRETTLLVRSAGEVAGLSQAVRAVVQEIDASVPVRSTRPLPAIVRDAYATAWITMGLLTVLAALATALGAIGIHAVLANHVARRQKELGVRLALGAKPQELVGMVVRSGLGLAAFGIALGTAVAFGAVGVLESLLFGVSALGAWTFLFPAGTLLLAAMIAAAAPAARAAALPPARVLREE